MGILVNVYRKSTPLVVAASLLALAACEADSTGPGLAAEGSVSFTYAGDDAGTYSATGRFDRQNPDDGTFAVGGRGELENGQDGLVVYAHAERAALVDEFLLSVENPELGTVTCDADDTSCSFGALFFLGTDVEGETDAIYTSVSGTLNITSLNDDRASGTFTLELEAFDLIDDPGAVTVTSGTFNVPIVQNN
jgi:hypothetical protein